MKIYKIFNNKNIKLLDDNIDGEKVILVNDSVALNNYVFDKEIEENNLYIIEVSPDINNPLNYTGIQIALQIYFKHLQANKLLFKIILLGFDTKLEIFEEARYALFLKCPNVIYQQAGLDWNIRQHFTTFRPVDKKRAVKCLKSIGIRPPASYKSHHTITNEWSIYRWSHYLGKKTLIDKEIEKSLYFQYLKTIYQIEPVKKNINFLVSDGKLLIIDDEINKGWKNFFNTLKLPGGKLSIEFLGEKFKNISKKEDIIKKTQSKIEEFQPDTIILDLRLHDSDFDEINPKNLSGYKILEVIKKINPGIQVIIFTASNKIWNYQSLNKIGFDGWILKESPELSTDENYTKNAINELKTQINTCLDKKYLKEIFQKKQLLYEQTHLSKTNNKLFEQLKKQIDLAYNMLLIAKTKNEFAYAYISLYLVIELINNELVYKTDKVWQIEDAGDLLDWHWDDENKVFTNTGNTVTADKVPHWHKFSGIYFQKWQLQDQNFVRKVSFAIRKRNGFIHNDKDILDYKDKGGKFVNHDIYTYKGFVNLFGLIEEIWKNL